MRRAFQTPQSAYRRVKFRRENPHALEEEPPAYQPQNTGRARRLTEFEQEALFQDWVQKFMGTNPDKMDDAAYAVTPRQQARIIDAAQAWLMAHPEHAEFELRFDAMLIAPRRLPRHVLAAFDAST